MLQSFLKRVISVNLCLVDVGPSGGSRLWKKNERGGFQSCRRMLIVLEHCERISLSSY